MKKKKMLKKVTNLNTRSSKLKEKKINKFSANFPNFFPPKTHKKKRRNYQKSINFIVIYYKCDQLRRRRRCSCWCSWGGPPNKIQREKN